MRLKKYDNVGLTKEYNKNPESFKPDKYFKRKIYSEHKIKNMKTKYITLLKKIKYMKN